MTYSEKRNALPPAVPAFGLCGLLLAGTSYLNIALQRNIERRAGAVPCLADYFVSQKSNFYFLFLILPLFLCSLTFLMRHDSLTVFILRSGSRKRLWLKQAGLTVQYGGATSLLYTAVTGAAGSLFSQQYINWQSPESFYFLTGHGTLSLPLWEVAACFFLSCFFAYAAAGLLLILVWWVTSHAALGWLAVILLCGWDSMMPGSPVFLGLGSLSYSQWQCGTVVRNTGILLLLQLALFFAGLKYADRKDFLGDGYV